MLLRFLVTLIAQDERIRRMGPRALLLLIPVAAVAVVYWFTRSLVASLALVALGTLVLWVFIAFLRWLERSLVGDVTSSRHPILRQGLGLLEDGVCRFFLLVRRVAMPAEETPD